MSQPPFKPYETALAEKVELAQHEFDRPAVGLFLSGLLAGLGVGVLITATRGNILGGVASAVLLRFSVVIGEPGGRTRRRLQAMPCPEGPGLVEPASATGAAFRLAGQKRNGCE